MWYLPQISSLDSEGFEDNFMSVSDHSLTVSIQEPITPPLFPLSGISATSEQVPPEQDTIPLPAIQGVNPHRSKRLRAQDMSPERLYFKDWTFNKLIKTLLKNSSGIPAGSNRKYLFIFYCESISAEPIFPPKKTPQLRSAVQRPRSDSRQTISEQATPATSTSSHQQAATPASKTQQEHSHIFNEIKAFMQPFAYTLSSVNTKLSNLDKRVSRSSKRSKVLQFQYVPPFLP
ncbi:UNVERIFIED_CONTAM: hypothetical protein FKN15_035774 [Acipenser sinensis]